ncbi:MAG: UbiA family prenyltransferase [Deferribacteraceae bacterium]|jgi:1,4-dihydroxy-2-naphthoate octaprenyltransferase|nr:UbiA family prenyltransferase [Deferribacteraceae bacterium]
MNTAKIWLLAAARSRTLMASISSVLVACALAQHGGDFNILLIPLCLLVALLAQMAFKLANDYFGYSKDYGRSRLKPKHIMIILIVCVLLFYGIIPICISYGMLTGGLSMDAFLLSLAMGALSTNILVVNNYRDMDDDRRNSLTRIVTFERGFGTTFYLANGFAAIDLAVIALFPLLHRLWVLILFMLFVGLFLYTWHALRTSGGRMLNRVLGHTIRNVLIFAILLSIVLL